MEANESIFRKTCYTLSITEPNPQWISPTMKNMQVYKVSENIKLLIIWHLESCFFDLMLNEPTTLKYLFAKTTSMKKEVLIIGAGKIGRGFIAQLFYNSGYKLWFLDASKEVVQLLNKEKKYRIDLAKEGGDVTEYIEVEGAFTLDEKEKVAGLLNKIDIVVSSVGADNIEKVTRFIKDILINTGREKVLNWMICENANNPAKKIKGVCCKMQIRNLKNLLALK